MKQRIDLQMIARWCGGIAVALALVAFVSGLAGLGKVPSETLVVELWRVIGYLTFAALFAWLMVFPTKSLAMWAIVAVNKIVLVGCGIVLSSSIVGASDLVLWDGILVFVLGIGMTSVYYSNKQHISERSKRS